MISTNKPIKITTTLEHTLVSNFFRLCAAEGVDSESAYRELEMRLEALGELKPPEHKLEISSRTHTVSYRG